MADYINGSNIGDASNLYRNANSYSSVKNIAVNMAAWVVMQILMIFISSPETSGLVRLVLSEMSNLDVHLYVNDGSGKLVFLQKGIVPTGSSDKTISTFVDSQKTYYVWVDPIGTAVSNYKLTQTFVDSLDLRVFPGNKVNNRMIGNDQNNTMAGYAGNDTINGGAGNDTIYGGTGNDSLDGGTGNDQIRGDEGNDTINGGTGNDTISGGEGNAVLWVVKEMI